MSETTPDPRPPTGRSSFSLPAHWRELWVVRFWPLTVPAALLVLVVLATAALFATDYRAASVPAAGEAALRPPTVLVDVHGQELGKLDPAVVGEQVTAGALPDHVADAILAAEDRGFREHGGFSLRATVRAAWANLRSGEVEQGASTITQQYVDLTTPGAGRNLRAKLREAAAAMKFEDELGKDEILDRYLNLVPLGRNAIGIDQAARVYFRVPAAEMDVNQAATLAGMIAAPSAFDPERHPEAARSRRNHVLDGMGARGWLDDQQASQLRRGPLPEVADEPLVQFGASAYVVDAVRRRLEDQLGKEGLGRGLVVQTTIDMRMQEAAQQTLRDHVGEQPWTGAIVSVDPASGAVRALVGGSDFAEEQFNSAVQARRQPGSAFKPFTLAAFVEAGYDPWRSTFDAPARIEVESGGETVEVNNFSHRGYGELTAHEATVNSVNTAYMQLVDAVGPSSVVSLAHEMGIRSDLPAVPSIALGTGAVTPLELASAYSTLPARGVHRAAVLIRSVTEVDGQVIHEADVTEQRALTEQTAGVVTDVLHEVVQRGTGTAAQIGRPVAGKTGTTNDSRDAWFAGYAGQLATVVWMGNADNSPMPDATGGSLAAPAWADYMSTAMEPIPVVELPTADREGLEAYDGTDSDVEVTTPSSPANTSPTPTPTSTGPSSPPTPGPTSSPSPTDTQPSPSPSSPSPSNAPSPTSSPSSSPSPTSSPSSSPSPTSSPSSSPSPTSSPSSSPSPTSSPSSSPSPSPSP